MWKEAIVASDNLAILISLALEESSPKPSSSADHKFHGHTNPVILCWVIWT
jgi:hypothetical protein